MDNSKSSWSDKEFERLMKEIGVTFIDVTPRKKIKKGKKKIFHEKAQKSKT